MVYLITVTLHNPYSYSSETEVVRVCETEFLAKHFAYEIMTEIEKTRDLPDNQKFTPYSTADVWVADNGHVEVQIKKMEFTVRID